MLFGKGHIPQTAPHPMALPIAHLIGGAATAPAACSDLLAFVDAPRNQLSTNACVAFALARAAHVRAAAAGRPIPHPAELLIYAEGRGWPPYADEGMDPSRAVDAMRTIGMVDEARWPFDEGKVNTPPPWDVYRHAVAARMTGLYFIPDAGDARCDAIRRAISSKFPIAFAMQVDSAYEQGPGGAALHQLGGPSVGTHMQAALAYDADGVTVLNSWGYWNGAGFSKLGWDFIGGSTCLDFYALDAAPAVLS